VPSGRIIRISVSLEAGRLALRFVVEEYSYEMTGVITPSPKRDGFSNNA
jgi:hypothetical protein